MKNMSEQKVIGYPLREEEILSLSNSNGGLEWLIIRNKIKSERDNQLPPDWFDTVIASGLVEDKIATWEAANHYRRV